MTAGNERERQLARRAQKGDRAAFEQLVIEHQGDLRRFCRLLLRNATEADDAAQEAFFKAYRSIKQYQGQGTFKSWLLGIAANQCKDALRARQRAPGASEDWASAVDSGQAADFRAEEERLEHKQLADVALQQVPPHYRTVLVLREVAGFEYGEIAKLLSCSLDAVKARLRRAREEFGNALRANSL